MIIGFFLFSIFHSNVVIIVPSKRLLNSYVPISLEESQSLYENLKWNSLLCKTWSNYNDIILKMKWLKMFAKRLETGFSNIIVIQCKWSFMVSIFNSQLLLSKRIQMRFFTIPLHLFLYEFKCIENVKVRRS